MTDRDSAKLTALVTLLTEIGVGPRSDTRAVVFSERVPTLKWLADGGARRSSGSSQPRCG